LPAVRLYYRLGDEKPNAQATGSSAVTLLEALEYALAPV
jgi:hypothetical protein